MQYALEQKLLSIKFFAFLEIRAWTRYQIMFQSFTTGQDYYCEWGANSSMGVLKLAPPLSSTVVACCTYTAVVITPPYTGDFRYIFMEYSIKNPIYRHDYTACVKQWQDLTQAWSTFTNATFLMYFDTTFLMYAVSRPVLHML